MFEALRVVTGTAVSEGAAAVGLETNTTSPIFYCMLKLQILNIFLKEGKKPVSDTKLPMFFENKT